MNASAPDDGMARLMVEDELGLREMSDSDCVAFVRGLLIYQLDGPLLANAPNTRNVIQRASELLPEGKGLGALSNGTNAASQ